MISRRQRIASSLLITSLVLGSVAAPLSHYLWMSAAGHFDRPHHEHGVRGTHHDGRTIMTDRSGSPWCHYSDLFATHVAGAPDYSSIDGHDPAPTAVLSADVRAPSFDKYLDRLTRGPPAA